MESQKYKQCYRFSNRGPTINAEEERKIREDQSQVFKDEETERSCWKKERTEDVKQYRMSNQLPKIIEEAGEIKRT